MGNLSREALAHYLDYSFKQTVASATWEILGDDIDDMSVDLNPDTETKKNILGQTKTTDNGYEPSMDADTYYANPDKKLYPKIRDIAMKRLKGADCKTLMLEVLVEDTSADNHLAYVEEVMVKPQSYGGEGYPAGLSESHRAVDRAEHIDYNNGECDCRTDCVSDYGYRRGICHLQRCEHYI